METVSTFTNTISYTMNNNLSESDLSRPSDNKVDINEYPLIREKFRCEYEANKELYEECDYQNVMTNDFWVKRYGYAASDKDKWFEKLRTAMRWRKSYQINHFDASIIPKEVYQLSPIILYEPDRIGRSVLIVRGKMHRKIPPIQDRLNYYLAYMINRVDAVKSSESSWLLLLDASGTGFANADLEMINFLQILIREYFPFGSKIFVYGMPWLLNAFASFVLSFINSEYLSRIKFGGKEDLLKLIAPENLPDFLDGSCERPYRIVPKCAISAHELNKKDNLCDPKEIDQLLKPYQKMIEPEKCHLVDKY